MRRVFAIDVLACRARAVAGGCAWSRRSRTQSRCARSAPTGGQPRRSVRVRRPRPSPT